MNAEAINSTLIEHQLSELPGWDHRQRFGLFRRFFDVVNKRYFAAEPLPVPAFSVEASRSRVELGYHREGRNAFGLCHHINISAHAAAELSELEQLEILGHEVCHQWEYLYRTPPKTSWYHSRAFCEMAERIGIVAKQGRGHTLELRDPFVAICRELGVEDPIPRASTEGEGSSAIAKLPPRKGSSLTKWACRCTPPVNLRVGRAQIHVRCEDCGARFEQVE